MTKQWGKLPVGTRLVDNAHGEWQVVGQDADGAYVGPEYVWGREWLYGGLLIFTVDELERGEHNVRLDPVSFADIAARDELAKLGFFSIDHNGTVERHQREREEEQRRADAYALLGLDRTKVHDAIAAVIDTRDAAGDIRAKSTGEWAKKRYAVDNAILYAAGVIDHA